MNRETFIKILREGKYSEIEKLKTSNLSEW